MKLYGVFILRYKSTIIGELRYDNNWIFQYTEEFKESELATLLEFPDVDKTYKSDRLWVFFDTRIPPINRIEKEIEEEGLDTDKVALLKRFGVQTINNPYILEYAH